jgi:lycopene beta-cyclase
MTLNQRYDYCLIGGGLQAGLISLALAKLQPQCRLLLIEKNQRLAGNHTWSSHQSDIPANCRAWMGQVPVTQWPRYLVRLDGYERVVELGYQSIRSEQFGLFLQQLFAGSKAFHLLTETAAQPLDANRLILTSGERAGREVSADCVIDCRGPLNDPQADGQGYQKFFGWEVELPSDWKLPLPIVMDTTSRQLDGFRFTYVLPFTDRRILLQDTWFSNQPICDPAEGARQLRNYLAQYGHGDFLVVREEHGCLPMPFFSQSESGDQVLTAGYRGGWFHAATGYSMPLAVRVADTIARVPAVQANLAISRLKKKHQFQTQFARFLNRMLFCLVKPEARRQIFERFYRTLPESLISRFYAHTFTPADALRLLLGRPPGGLTPFQFLQSYRSTR